MELSLPILTELWQQMAAVSEKQIQRLGKYLAFAGFLSALLSIAKSLFFLGFDWEGGISFVSVLSLDFQSSGCFLKLFLPKGCKEIGCFHNNLLLETCNLYFPQCLLYLKVIKNNSTSK